VVNTKPGSLGGWEPGFSWDDESGSSSFNNILTQPLSLHRNSRFVLIPVSHSRLWIERSAMSAGPSAPYANNSTLADSAHAGGLPDPQRAPHQAGGLRAM
jgi:hypothetical protein